MTKQILIVSPLKKNYDSVCNKLKKLGFKFFFAFDLENAQLHLLRDSFSLTVLDIDFYKLSQFFKIMNSMKLIGPFSFIFITTVNLDFKEYKGLKAIMFRPANNDQLIAHILSLT